ncbi:uncharacterized protein SAPINGB_P002365 [Magnusiomyces paraingens]|uniref:N-acetyltransferase domain-containing protein n=1 Tax=Magnusiomyces paraingens TaxID=2606893 RepID=A0A5E8BFM3_9ASCO|nr:uncharacterized protein SAPINGB_P002365 [Saprochaete ingens]VVT49631.1 unnamed protein product [Saprochaete ingens]
MLAINPTTNCTFLPLLPFEGTPGSHNFESSTATATAATAATAATSTTTTGGGGGGGGGGLQENPVLADFAAVLIANAAVSVMTPSANPIIVTAEPTNTKFNTEIKAKEEIQTKITTALNNPNIVAVSRAQFKHVLQIQDLVARALQATYSPGFFFAYLYQPAHVLVVALSSNTSSSTSQPNSDQAQLPPQVVVGVAAGFVDAKTHACRSPWLSTVSGYVSVLAVSSEHRGKGLGSQLLQELERQLVIEAAQWRPQGGVFQRGDAILSALVLDVATENGTAQKFYDAQGFYCSSKVKPGYYTMGKSAIEMTKMLIG